MPGCQRGDDRTQRGYRPLGVYVPPSPSPPRFLEAQDRASSRIACAYRRWAETTQCRICLSPGAKPVCACSGRAHVSCIQEWARTSGRASCELCLTRFLVPLPPPPPNREQEERRSGGHGDHGDHGDNTIIYGGGVVAEQRRRRRRARRGTVSTLEYWCEFALRVVSYIAALMVLSGAVMSQHANAAAQSSSDDAPNATDTQQAYSLRGGAAYGHLW